MERLPTTEIIHVRLSNFINHRYHILIRNTMPIILGHKRAHRYRLMQRRDNVIPIPMLEKMIRERLVINRFPVQVIVALHGQFRRNVDGGMKWVFEPIIFREVDAVPTPREILVPNCGVDDADGTFNRQVC